MTQTNSLDLEWLSRYRASRKILPTAQYLVFKRFFDILILLMASPVWLPLLGVLALIVKITSPGAPVFFNQRRTGKNGKRFTMYKFRTMVPNAEALKEQYRDLNTLKWPDFKIPNDPRITGIGKILRKTSLDELPQVLNVLKGDMSLVGPRPTSFSADTYMLWETERLEVVPGLTGLWQICDRGRTNFDDRARLDIVYIQSRCLALDLEIIIRTFLSVVKMKGAF